MRIFVYKMTHDDGAAPCVQDDLLTLAICKPTIRKKAEQGDYIVGIGGKDLGIGRVIYAAEVLDVAGREYYANYNRRDCVYEDIGGKPVHRGEEFDHADPRWRSMDVRKDWGNARVLLSDDFRYFGGKGPGFLDLLAKYENLRSLVEIDRTHIPDPALRCLLIDDSRPECDDILDVLAILWKRSSVPADMATHYRDDPRPWDWKDYNREVKAWRKTHQFDAEKFRFKRTLKNLEIGKVNVYNPRDEEPPTRS